jgi:hypothetical protein
LHKVCDAKKYLPLQPAPDLPFNVAIYYACQELESRGFSSLVETAILAAIPKSTSLDVLGAALDNFVVNGELFRAFAKRWAEFRFFGKIDDEGALDKWIQTRPDFQVQVGKTREFHSDPELLSRFRVLLKTWFNYRYHTFLLHTHI